MKEVKVKNLVIGNTYYDHLDGIIPFKLVAIKNEKNSICFTTNQKHSYIEYDDGTIGFSDTFGMWYEK